MTIDELIENLESVSKNGKCIDAYTEGDSVYILKKLRDSSGTIYSYSWKWYLLFILATAEAIGFTLEFLYQQFHKDGD